MLTTKTFAMALLLSLSLSALTATAAERVAAIPDETYDAISFGDRVESPDFVIVAGAENIGGRVAVCGLVFFTPTGSSAKPYETQVTRKIKFYLNGQKLTVQTGAFRRYPSEEAAIKGGAGCSVTRFPWQEGFDRRTFEIRASDVTLKLSQNS